MAEREILREMRSVLAEVRALGPCLDGNLLKNKSNRREARKDFNDMLRLLKTHMLAASDACTGT